MPSYPHIYSTLNIISWAISILGSSASIYVILKSRDKLKPTLHQILFCLCIGDIIVSFAFLFTKTTVKSEDRLNADGKVLYSIPVATNQAARNAQGFFFVLGCVLSPFYNCSLCVLFYFLCVIKFWLLRYQDQEEEDWTISSCSSLLDVGVVLCIVCVR